MEMLGALDDDGERLKDFKAARQKLRAKGSQMQAALSIVQDSNSSLAAMMGGLSLEVGCPRSDQATVLCC